MGWEKISANDEFMVYERPNRGYTTRIEARQEEDRWMIYNTYFNNKGLNLTEEFEAKTKDEADKVISILQQQPSMTLTSLKKRMLDRRKKTEVRIQRSYKEYNVEKWFFGINNDKPINFAVLRFYDTIEIDFVVHERYRRHENDIIKSILQALGLHTVEEDVVVNCYYFNRHNEDMVENSKRKMLLGNLEFGFGEEE